MYELYDLMDRVANCPEVINLSSKDYNEDFEAQSKKTVHEQRQQPVLRQQVQRQQVLRRPSKFTTFQNMNSTQSTRPVIPNVATFNEVYSDNKNIYKEMDSYSEEPTVVKVKSATSVDDKQENVIKLNGYNTDLDWSVPRRKAPKCIPQEDWGVKPMYSSFNYDGMKAGDLLEVKNSGQMLPKFKYKEFYDKSKY
jgi:hypothetical protein